MTRADVENVWARLTELRSMPPRMGLSRAWPSGSVGA